MSREFDRVSSWRPCASLPPPPPPNSHHQQPQPNFRDFEDDHFGRRGASTNGLPQADRWRPSYAREEEPASNNYSDKNWREHGRDNFRPAQSTEGQEASRARNREGNPNHSSTRQTVARVPETSKVMPKNFTQPLTCFYWANQGHCSKSNEECWYAHYWTGVVAGAPVKIGDGATVAGREAEKLVKAVSEREADLSTRENSIARREVEIFRQKQAIAQKASNLKVLAQEVYTALGSIVESNDDASLSLERRRAELTRVLGQLAEQQLSMQPLYGTVATVDGVLASLATHTAKAESMADRLQDNMRLMDDMSNIDDGGQMTSGSEEHSVKIEDYALV